MEIVEELFERKPKVQRMEPNTKDHLAKEDKIEVLHKEKNDFVKEHKKLNKIAKEFIEEQEIKVKFSYLVVYEFIGFLGHKTFEDKGNINIISDRELEYGHIDMIKEKIANEVFKKGAKIDSPENIVILNIVKMAIRRKNKNEN